MGCRFVDTRSLKHIAKSANVATVSASSRDSVAPVTRASVFRIAARSVGIQPTARGGPAVGQAEPRAAREPGKTRRHR